MNLFKGLLYLDTSKIAPEFADDEPHYGAATAAREFGRELGNRAASERWFGPRHAANADAFGARIAPMGCG